MLTNSECYRLAGKKIREIFGREYLLENKEKFRVSRSDRGDEYWFFVFIKSKTDTPHLMPNHKGWTVYADIRVVKETGEIKVVDYQTEY